MEHIDNVIELIQSNFPEENQLEGLVDELKIKTTELKESIKTIVDKIKLDASEGLKTNCLYAEMFAHVLKDKIDVFLRVSITNFVRFNILFYLSYKLLKN